MLDLLDNLPVLLLAVTGAFISELAGALNIAMEGIMLLGSFLAAISIQGQLGNVPGVLMAAGAGLLLGLFLGVLHGRLGANIFIAGLGLNLVAISLTSILGQMIFGTKGVIPMPGVPSGELMNLVQLGIAVMVFLFVLVSFSWSLMGLRFRSLANHSEMLYARGVNTTSYRVWALGVSGALAAMAGAFASMSLGAYVPGGTSGKGWIALVLVYAGGKHPVGILLACILFVGMDQLSTSLQHTMDNPGLIIGLPYLGVLGILVVVQLLTRKKFEL